MEGPDSDLDDWVVIESSAVSAVSAVSAEETTVVTTTTTSQQAAEEAVLWLQRAVEGEAWEQQQPRNCLPTLASMLPLLLKLRPQAADNKSNNNNNNSNNNNNNSNDNNNNNNNNDNNIWWCTAPHVQLKAAALCNTGWPAQGAAVLLWLSPLMHSLSALSPPSLLPVDLHAQAYLISTEHIEQPSSHDLALGGVHSLSASSLKNNLRLSTSVKRENVFHPFTGALCDSVRVVKVFDSHAHPLLLEWSMQGERCPPLTILKAGDDLNVDLSVQVCFSVFNTLWESCASRFPPPLLPYAKTYDVLPLSASLGLLEVVPDSVSVSGVSWNDMDKHRTPSSAAGAFVAGFMLGVRDRHKHNILFNTNTLEIFHIDFGFVFDNQTKLFDAPRFAIPSRFMTALQELGWWDRFVDACVAAYLILRQHRPMLESICVQLFGESCRHYLETEAFMGDISEEEACGRVRRLVQNGPKSWKRWAKNITHKMGF